jgi:hypothetical protein
MHLLVLEVVRFFPMMDRVEYDHLIYEEERSRKP